MDIRVLVLTVPLLIAGCASNEEAVSESSASPATSSCAADCLLQPDGVSPPKLAVGTTWHYKSKLFYDVATSQNITVAKVIPGGYLFTGTSKEDLIGEALWDRHWYGPHAANLTSLGARSQWISFPLFDGKTWEFDAARGERAARTATAHAKSVTTPDGMEDGFTIDVEADQLRFHAEYAPSVGYFTLLESTWMGVQEDRLELTGITRSTTAVWFEPGKALDVGSAAHKTLDMPSGYDSLLASAGGESGGRAIVTPPASAARAPWMYEGKPGGETWSSANLAATSGTWAFAVTDPQSCKSCFYLRVLPVKWVEP